MPLLIGVAIAEACICPARVGLACSRAYMSTWGWNGDAVGWAYHEARGLDFRARQCGCGTACSRRHWGHPWGCRIEVRRRLVGKRERETGTDLILGSSISY